MWVDAILKKPGCCTSCGTDIYEVRDYWTEGPFTGEPRRVGRMKDNGTQLVFRLSDGSEADISCCLDCAGTVTAADYPAIWRRVIDRELFQSQAAHRSERETRQAVAHLEGLFIVGLLRRRREHPIMRGELMVDDR